MGAAVIVITTVAAAPIVVLRDQSFDGTDRSLPLFPLRHRH